MAKFSIEILSIFLLHIIVSGIALAPLEEIDVAGKASSLAPDLSEGPNTGLTPMLGILDAFSTFIATFDKVYPTIPELVKAFENFAANYQTIVEHNNSTSQYTLGIYETMDQTGIIRGLGFNDGDLLGDLLDGALYFPPELYNPDIPESWDWRDYGAVTTVKNQGSCGSCWAFSTVGALEGTKFVAGGFLDVLSEQELVDCVENFTCETGGTMVEALQNVAVNGLGGADCYPYTGQKAGACGRTAFCQDIKPGQVQELYTVHAGDEEELRQLVYSKGPVSVAVYVDDLFQLYKSGIMFRPTCNLPPNHAVLIVGYGREGGLDYWIVKNSWGGDWGEGGYFRMQRNTMTLNIGFDYCGITLYAVTPKMD